MHEKQRDKFETKPQITQSTGYNTSITKKIFQNIICKIS